MLNLQSIKLKGEFKMAEKTKIWYRMNDVPSPGKTIVYALQHLADTIPATVVIPLIVGGVLGLSPAEMAKWIGLILFGMGICTVLQSTWGTKYPIVQGGSYSFISPYIVVASMVGGGVSALPVIMTALMLGACVEMVIGYGRLMGYIRRALSPLVIGIVIVLICLSLFPFAISSASEHWGIAAITLFSMLICALLIPRLFPRVAYIQTFSYLIGMGLGYAVSAGMGIIDYGPIVREPWFMVPTPFAWGLPVFNAGAFVAILAGYFASMIESYGDYHACAAVIDEPMPDKARINRGIGFEGLGCGIAGLFGGAGATSYTDNIGIIGLTGVASRRVVQVAGILLIMVGFLGKFGAVWATIPNPVMGGAWIVVWGFVIGYGINWIAKADLTSARNVAIVGICLIIGLGLPQAIGENPVVIATAPGLAGIINAILSVPMAVGGILAIILEYILPGRMKPEQLEAIMRGETS